MNFGYLYAPIEDARTKECIARLNEAGCQRVFIEVNRQKRNRIAFQELLDTLRPGDTLVVVSLVSIGRTSKQLIDLLFRLHNDKIQFKCLMDTRFDTTTQEGKIVVEALVALSQIEGDVRSSNIRNGLKVARARGRKGGRRRGSYDKTKAVAAATLYKQGVGVAEIIERMQIARSTLYNYLRIEGIK